MPAVARDQDTCGGVIEATAIKTFVNGRLVARFISGGDPITPHGEDEHAAAVMAEGSTTVFAEGKPVCRFGDKASCEHTVSTASPDVFAG